MDVDLKSIISVKHNCIPCFKKKIKNKKRLFIRYTLTVTSRTLFKLSEIGSVNQLINYSNLYFEQIAVIAWLFELLLPS